MNAFVLDHRANSSEFVQGPVEQKDKDQWHRMIDLGLYETLPPERLAEESRKEHHQYDIGLTTTDKFDQPARS